MAENSDVEAVLREKARELRRTALPDWNDFITALEAYADERRRRVLTAGTTDQLIEFKGNALGVQWLAQILSTAHVQGKK